MGLDAVEILLRTEDEFSIAISDEEAASVTTVGGLYRIVLAKLDVKPGCLTSQAFYATRRALVDVLGIPRRSVRPSTTLYPLLPNETRRKQWEEIRRHLGLAIPGLRIPAELKQDIYKRAFFSSSALAVLACVVGLSIGWPDFVVLPLALALWIGVFMAGAPVYLRVSVPGLATELPADTAGELAQVVLTLNQDRFQSSSLPSEQTNEDVWRRLVDIICDQLQVKREEVVPNARFVDDLGVS